jgi:hypothetical protein
VLGSPELRRHGVRFVLRLLLALPGMAAAANAEDGVPRLLVRRYSVEPAAGAVDVAEVGGRGDAGGGVVAVEAGLGHIEAEAAGPGVETDPGLGRQRAEVIERGGVRVGGGHPGPEVVPGRRDRRAEDLGHVTAGAAVERVGLALVPVPEVLVRGLVGAHEVGVERREPAHEPRRHERVGDEAAGDGRLGHGAADADAAAPPGGEQQVHPAEAEHVEAQERGGRDEEEEEAVVPAPDALPHPGAVVVEALHAVVAHGAVRAARRPVQHARVAVLHLHRHAVHVHVPRRGQRPRRARRGGAGAHLRRRRREGVGLGRPRVPGDDPGVPPRRQHQHHHVLHTQHIYIIIIGESMVMHDAD